MTHPFRAWRASFTRRWHSNPDLCDTVDPDSGHQCRVALLVLTLWPSAGRELIVAAITHDQGEAGPGDMSLGTKTANPELRAMVAELEAAEIEAQGLPDLALTEEERAMLKLCDRLDSYLWMLHHMPHLARRTDWRKQASDTYAMAIKLSVGPEVSRLIKEADGAAG